MRRTSWLLAFLPLALLLSGDSARAEPPVTEFQLLTGFTAKESCSCAFVVGQTDDYCTAFGSQPGYAETVTIDHDAKTVTATFLGNTRTARVAAGGGCVLDPLP